MTRWLTALIAVIGIASFIAFDLQASPPNPYAAPPLLALGSGVQQTGGFCGALPD